MTHTSARPGFRGLLTWQGMFGLVMLLPAVYVLYEFVDFLWSGSEVRRLTWSLLLRGVGACVVFVLVGSRLVYSAWIGEDAMRERKARARTAKNKRKARQSHHGRRRHS